MGGMDTTPTTGQREFVHPYYFVRTPPRPVGGPLADAAPPAHDRYHPKLVNARLTIHFKAVTPVVARDEGRPHRDNADHRVYGTRAAPFLTETGLKGAVRTAVEAVTNSRFPVFDHAAPERRGGGVPDPHLHEHADEPDRAGHRPAPAIGWLSPADRLFGWVSPAGGRQRVASYRGQLRPMGLALAEPAEPEVLPEPVVLAVLSGPKPSYARFYLGDEQGEPLAEGGDRAACDYGADPAWRLRGRKVYPHQRCQPDDWDRGDAAFRAAPPTPVAANQTLTSWVPIGTRWQWTVEVTNAEPAVLGALLWVLARPAGEHLKVGGGKPFGFGSVHASLDYPQSTVWAGADRQAALAAGRPHRPAALTGADDDRVAEPVAAFGSAVEGAYESPLEEVAFVADWLAASRGQGELPVHYPRPDPHNREVAGHRWFRQNEGRGGRGLALPAMLEPLPYDPRDRRR
jgi:hypothetical protein